jgi:2-polyprenyl-6-hydroxyphenyl methylase / 3-demethylubiquinone-9 3-methyltransferase
MDCGWATCSNRSLSIADIGCGAGLMYEPLAGRGAQVVGVDAVARNITAARLHAVQGRLPIDYRVGEPDAALGEADSFDVLLLLEVVEHVDNLQAFVQQAARHLKPGSLLLVSSINRTAPSFVTAIVGAEYVFRLLPRGPHRWAQFVRPDELRRAALACGLVQHHCRGMGYLPAVHRA